MKTKRFLLHVHAAEEALWTDNREILEGIAHEVACRYGLRPDDAELVIAEIRGRLWEKLGNIARARNPDALARTTAYQAATDAAIALLPDDRRLHLVDQRRARRRKNQSSDRPSVQN